jgi:hypothetical protein
MSLQRAFWQRVQLSRAMPNAADARPTKPTFSRPLPFVRGRSRRRIEVFSPKLARRVSFASYAQWKLWLALEANPLVVTFCERPSRLDAANSSVIDFWVQLRSPAASEFWLLDVEDGSNEIEVVATPATVDDAPIPSERVRGLPIRHVTRTDLCGWTTPVANWARIVPYLVVWSRFSDVVLAQAIVVYLERSHTLDQIMAHFADHDPPMVEAALYSLVANGRVLSSDLAVSPLGGATRFSRAIAAAT